jgi:hypothetical protein
MFYCVKCGVELADSEEKCPLCKTTAYHPELVRPEGTTLFPTGLNHHEETIKISGVLFVLTVVLLIPIVLTLMFDVKSNGGVTWSGYVISAILLFYVVAILPIWFKRPNPVIFSSADFAAAALYLLFIDLLTQGGWFLPFAFPVTGGLALIVVAVITLVHYVKKGYLYIFGGAVIATGFLTMLIELLINVTFHLRNTLVWSIYPLVSCFLIGMALIVIAISRPLKESLHKKFFV